VNHHHHHQQTNKQTHHIHTSTTILGYEFQQSSALKALAGPGIGFVLGITHPSGSFEHPLATRHVVGNDDEVVW
jgi:hypothetical protein